MQPEMQSVVQRCTRRREKLHKYVSSHSRHLGNCKIRTFRTSSFLGLASTTALVLNGLTKTWTSFRDLLNKKHKNCELCRVTFITFMIWSVEIVMKYQCQCQNVSELSLSRLQQCEHSIVWTMHNVYFVQYVFLPTEQAEIYLKICVLIYHLTYICPSLFGWKENMIFEETKNVSSAVK